MSKREDAQSDPRVFKFAITCRHCKLSYYTLQTAKEHFTYQCPKGISPKIRCGCCNATFLNYPPVTSVLQIGTRPRDPADLWRERFYTLASMTEYFFTETEYFLTELAAPVAAEEAILTRASFLPYWPSSTDVTLPMSLLAQQLLPYFRQLADQNVEPDF